MGGLLSSIGLNGGANSNEGAAGANFVASGANIQNPATTAQANQLYNQAQSGLGQQQAFLNALQAQNGIANQSSVYNQLAGVANGQGPNPAAAMLSQATGANVANQAALMAGQRGAGSNVGLIARQAAQQGAASQQQAAGQAATMQANQSLNALGQLGGLATQQVSQQGNALTGLNQMTQNEQQNILGSIAAQNNANVGMQSNINNANAGIAQGVAKAQQGVIGGLANAAGGASGALLSGGGGMAQGGMVQQNPKLQQSRVMLADGGPVADAPTTNGPKSTFGKMLQGMFSNSTATAQNPAGAFSGGQEGDPNYKNGAQIGSGIGQVGVNIGKAIGNAMAKPAASDMNADTGESNFGAGDLSPNGAGGTFNAAKGGPVPAMLSPGEAYIPPKNVKAVAEKKISVDKAGKKIPGKAKVEGDSLKNDIVPAKLEEGGMVIPRSIMNSRNAPQKAADFVRASLSRSKRSRKK